jgi:hypothetical protein
MLDDSGEQDNGAVSYAAQFSAYSMPKGLRGVEFFFLSMIINTSWRMRSVDACGLEWK